MPEKEETSSTNVGNTSEEGKTLPKAVIKNVDMSEEMQQETISIAATALEKYSIEKDIASAIKKECDQRWQPTWHVVVGKNFGSYVTHGEFQHTCIPISNLFLFLRMTPSRWLWLIFVYIPC